jgi:hypothetical protein
MVNIDLRREIGHVGRPNFVADRQHRPPAAVVAALVLSHEAH